MLPLPARAHGWAAQSAVLLTVARHACGECVDAPTHCLRPARYVWPVTYNAFTLAKTMGEERSDVYGYIYLMMRLYGMTHNATFLEEASAAHATPGALHRQEFLSLYERPYLAWGALGLLMLGNATGNATTAQEAALPIAYMLPSLCTFQADHSFRSLAPVFMQVSAMRGAYSAAFETHHFLEATHKLLVFSAGLTPEYQLAPHVVGTLELILPFALGQMRYAYPDKIPALMFHTTACPAGPGTCSTFNFSNDRGVMVPVEDYWGASSHRGYSPFDDPAHPNDAPITVGHIGQEIYGAGGPIWYALWQDGLTAKDGHRNQ